jgi:micrococcal nuclease
MPKAKVQRVIDGDTFVTQSGKTVRLANVDAPEKGHKGAPAARKDLRELVSRKEVNVEVVARDKYGRQVANVKTGNRSVNKAMREKGWK